VQEAFVVSKARVGIINITGYAGVELARLLSCHPGVTLAAGTGRSAAEKKLAEVFPHLADLDMTITAELGEVDFAFSALPHKESAAEVAPLIRRGVKVVDISADFRLRAAADYPAWYGFSHPAPDFLSEAVYGLPELYRDEIKRARIVANPGCYPTGAILALAPALKAGTIEPDIIIDSKSGISGAGRSLSLTTHFAEAHDDVTAYALEGHRHLPEIIQELARLSPGKAPRITFIPHLIPMTRGILTTAYAPLAAGKLSCNQDGIRDLRQLYREFYKGKPFVRVVDDPPHTKHTWGANFCLVHPTIDLRAGRLIVVSAIDNLVKGAAGQAVQNMNLMLGLEETLGISSPAVFP
jgi:N-acetyl-gamma-glutamyl-phosphate reductase